MKMTVYELEPFAMGYIEAAGKSTEYRIAAGIKCFAENRPLSINPADVFVASYAEYGSMGISYDRSCGFVPEEDRIKKEKSENPEEAFELNRCMEVFRPLETLRIISKIRSAEQEQMEINKCAWAAGGGHSNPDYEMLLRIGTNGIREKIKKFRGIHTDCGELYDSFELVLDAVETVADRYREIAREMLPSAEGKDRRTLERLIEAFGNIPRNQPRNFFEACEMFWLTFAFIDIDSPGLFDYSLGRYYENDDPEDRYECLTALWECFKRTRTWNLCVGGSDEFGNDRTCALSYDVLKIAAEKKYDTPNITMRVHKGTPEALWQRAADTLATGIGMPAIYNDDCVCTALEAIGIPSSDAHLYCMNGCNQIDIFGKSHMGLEDGEISVAKALEFALSNGVCGYSGDKLGAETGDPAGFETFEQLFSAFCRQIDYLADYITATSNRAQELFAHYAPNPWKSVIVQGCIEKGLDYKNRGPYYGHAQILTEGLSDAADSLTAIKHFVYDEKKYTLGEVVDALRKDYEGCDEIFRDFSGYKKFGNDDDEPDSMYVRVSDYVYSVFRDKKTWRGGTFGVGCSTFNRAANYGSHLGALPNGKKRFAPLLADSIGPTPGCDVCGPTATLSSVMKANQFLATSGNVLQLKFQKEQFDTPTGKAAYIALAKAYFAGGGQTLQINVLSKEELLDAKIHPEKHGDLLVRVGGYSSYFVKLSPGLQDNIIARTEQKT